MWIADFPKLLLLHFSVDYECHNTYYNALYKYNIRAMGRGIRLMVDTPNLNHIVSSYMLIGLCKHKRHYIIIIIIVQSRGAKRPLSQKPRNNYTLRNFLLKQNMRTVYTIIIAIQPLYASLTRRPLLYTQCTRSRGTHNAQYRLYTGIIV